ncbi:putative double-stranded RNA/RNA-DNA hybrid binding protein [Ceratocystis lukuohia]|uniref:Double-stranded RNA/RNA-DNA hybrid binding protein n=1 Tax=Ceratocystis lukuohia TaxID=2019550 RepID=A0ABR4MCV8_9PEZI
MNTFEQACNRVVQSLNIETPGNEDLKVRLKRYLELLRTDWLLVLDNGHDPESVEMENGIRHPCREIDAQFWAILKALKSENDLFLLYSTAASLAVEKWLDRGVAQFLSDPLWSSSIDEAKALLPHPHPTRDSTKLRPEQEGPAESLAAKAHLDLLSKESQDAKPGTSQLAIDEIRRTLARWQGGSDNLALEKPVGKVRWVPGHCEVPGNEAVDQLAKAGCKSEDLPVLKATTSLTAAGRWRNEAFKADFQNWMKENCPKIKHLGGALNWPRPYDIGWMKGLHRGTVAWILAARSGHVDFEEYHVRLNHMNAEIRCPVAGCDEAKTFSHPWEL